MLVVTLCCIDLAVFRVAPFGGAILATMIASGIGLAWVPTRRSLSAALVAVIVHGLLISALPLIASGPEWNDHPLNKACFLFLYGIDVPIHFAADSLGFIETTRPYLVFVAIGGALMWFCLVALTVGACNSFYKVQRALKLMDANSVVSVATEQRHERGAGETVL